MHMALSQDDWLLLNTHFCNRLHARITVERCEENRCRDDGRCSGCEGLDEVHRELERKEPVVIESADVDVPATDAMSQALGEALQDILVGDDAAEMEAEDPDQEEAEDGDSSQLYLQLLALQDPPLEIEPPPSGSNQRRNPERKRRVAVYVGRCPRCRGYVLPDPEREFASYDVEAHRCFSCGYRTSPVYVWNRQAS